MADQEKPVAEHQPELPLKEAQPPKTKRSRTILWVTLAILLVGLIWALLWFFYFQYYKWTDDAYVNGNMVNVTPVISGTPVAFFTDDTGLVIEGQLLVLLDDTPYQIAHEKELKTLAATVLQVKQLYDNVKSSTASFENKRVLYGKANYDYENRSRLVSSQAVSQEDYTHSRDDLNAAKYNLEQAEAELQAAKAAAGPTPLEHHPLLEEQKNAVRQAFYNLKHCAIYAPMTGYVAQRAVEVGQWVTPLTYMLAIIPAETMWVDANYKETELTYMRVGQPATVTFDIYGSGVKYKGKVLGIASGSGSVFSLIPPQNATGNWIKIVQRLPVRIEIDPEMMKKYPLRLGISAEVTVDVTQTDLPMLVQVPSTEVVAKTNVFDLDFETLENLMNKIIKENSSN